MNNQSAGTFWLLQQYSEQGDVALAIIALAGMATGRLRDQGDA
jgi:hypothetical protein